MNKALIIAMVVLVLAGGIFFTVLWRLTPATTPINTNGSPQNSSGGTTNVTINTPATGGSTNIGSTNTTSVKTISVATSNGSTLEVRDFKSDKNVVTSPNIPGQYILAGGVDPVSNGAPYSTYFVDLDKSFTITLLQEPIGDVRKLAEQDLMRQLGITQNQACGLRYQVLVPYKVNSIYSGKNLGFSFCPGATPL